MRNLIIGGYGFAGRHLARHLVECGDDVAVTYLPVKSAQGKVVPAEVEEGSLLGVPLPVSAQSLALDVTDREAVGEVIALLRPDAVYHLAGITFVPEGESDFYHVLEVNTWGTIHILEAIRRHSPKTTMLFVSSAEVYGSPRPGGLPLAETSELRPISNYGVSKAAADLAAFKYYSHEKVHVVRVRPFPHIGPGQSESFAISNFAKQVARIKLGLCEPVIEVGNLESKRDYSDVSDIVRGYREALLNGQPGGVYNLCSGKSWGIGELLEKLIKVAEVEVKIETSPDRVRKVDIPDLYGSYEKARRDFGWSPRVELDATLGTIIDYWLEQLTK